MIRPLDAEVRSRLRSGIAITSVSQCVEELVLNSLDAAATCVSVRVDIPGFRVQVVDNGCGIRSEDLRLVGVRHATSKCHSLKDLEQLTFHGFRGEALASIGDICGILEIVSRHESSYKTLCKIFQRGKPLQVTESLIPRASRGTTVDVHDIFASLPVRRKLISDTLDFERIRHRIASIALLHHEVAFCLFNEATGSKCLQTHKCQSMLSAFSQLFGNARARSLKEIVYAHDQFKVTGYISCDNHHSKNLQFLYINGRLMLKTKIHKLINTMIGKSALVRSRSSASVKDKTNGSSPQTYGGREKYGVFVLNIECGVNEYDICLEPSKTLVEFQDWERVLCCVEKCLELFLERENLALRPDSRDAEPEEEISSSGAAVARLSEFEYHSSGENAGKRNIETENISRSLHSSTVHRVNRAAAQCAVEGRTVGQNIDSHPSTGNVDADSQGSRPSSETENSEEQFFSDASAEGSQTGRKFQELPDSSAAPLQQSKDKSEEGASGEHATTCQQQKNPTTENNISSFVIQGRVVGNDCGKRRGDSGQVRSVSDAFLLHGSAQIRIPDKTNMPGRKIGTADLGTDVEDTRVHSHREKVVQACGRGRELNPSLKSFRFAKQSRGSACSRGGRSEYTTSRSSDSTRRREMTAEQRTETPSACDARALKCPAFTSPNPITLPRPLIRKRDMREGLMTADQCERTKKCIVLKRTPGRTPRSRLGAHVSKEKDRAKTPDASRELRAERDDGAGGLVGPSRSALQMSGEQAGDGAVELGLISDRRGYSGLCGVSSSRRDGEQGEPSDSPQAKEGDSTTHDGKLSRQDGCDHHARAGEIIRRNIGESVRKTFDLFRCDSVGADLLGDPETRGSEACDSSREQFMGQHERVNRHQDEEESVEGRNADALNSRFQDTLSEPEVTGVVRVSSLSVEQAPSGSLNSVGCERTDASSMRDSENAGRSSDYSCGPRKESFPSSETFTSLRVMMEGRGGGEAVSQAEWNSDIDSTQPQESIQGHRSEDRSRGQASSPSHLGVRPVSSGVRTESATEQEIVGVEKRGANVAREIDAPSPTAEQEWTCAFDASRGRTLYINLRTGNSSFDPPAGEEHSQSVTPSGEGDANQCLVAAQSSVAVSRRPLVAAPHLSLACTPWMPREGRRRLVTLAADDILAGAGAGGCQSFL